MLRVTVVVLAHVLACPVPRPTVQPLLPANHVLQAYFIDRWYAVAIPAGLIVVLFAFVATFIMRVLAKAAAAKKSK